MSRDLRFSEYFVDIESILSYYVGGGEDYFGMRMTIPPPVLLSRIYDEIYSFVDQEFQDFVRDMFNGTDDEGIMGIPYGELFDICQSVRFTSYGDFLEGGIEYHRYELIVEILRKVWTDLLGNNLQDILETNIAEYAVKNVEDKSLEGIFRKHVMLIAFGHCFFNDQVSGDGWVEIPDDLAVEMTTLSHGVRFIESPYAVINDLHTYFVDADADERKRFTDALGYDYIDDLNAIIDFEDKYADNEEYEDPNHVVHESVVQLIVNVWVNVLGNKMGEIRA